VTSLAQFEAAFLNFFTTGMLRELLSPSILFHLAGSLRRDVLEECYKKLQVLHEWMSVQVHYKFVASSLLFVFDGIPDFSFYSNLFVSFPYSLFHIFAALLTRCSLSAELPLRANVTMIDFAHVFEVTNGSTDTGYIKGLETLLALIKRYDRE
jgi:hypothetical protein